MRYNPTTHKVDYYPIKGINQLLTYGKDTLFVASTKGVIIFNIQTEKGDYLPVGEKEKSMQFITQSLCIPLPPHSNFGLEQKEKEYSVIS